MSLFIFLILFSLYLYWFLMGAIARSFRPLQAFLSNVAWMAYQDMLLFPKVKRRRYFCYVLTFWPGQKCHSRWCTGRKWHILMAVIRRNRVGGNWLMKWDEVKKIPWYSHRLTHRKRVTSELQNSYFRSMTITQAIPKIAEVTHPGRNSGDLEACLYHRVGVWR